MRNTHQELVADARRRPYQARMLTEAGEPGQLLFGADRIADARVIVQAAKQATTAPIALYFGAHFVESY